MIITTGAWKKMGAWVRVRDEGGGLVTLNFKHVQDWSSVHGTKEISVEVGDFDDAYNLFFAIGLENKSYQETKREKWILGEVEATIDTWPWIPTFLKLEGPAEDKLKETAGKLRLDWRSAKFGSVEVVYKQHYDVADEEIDGWENITFTPVPEWLEVRRKS